jgi:cytosine/adenosine deaminase-related metal-dependent hydrolase
LRRFERTSRSGNILLKNLSALTGHDMEFVRRGFIEIEGSRISKVGEGTVRPARREMDCRGLIAVPGFVDAHTHVGDSVAKDVGIGLPIAEVVSPTRGLKHQILRSTSDAELVAAMRESLTDMIRSGITTHADFREGGARGVRLLLEAADGLPIRTVILGRFSEVLFTSDELDGNTARLPDRAIEEASEVLLVAHGISSSSANDLTDPAMQQLSDLTRKSAKLRATHVAEARESVEKSKRRAGMTDVERVVKYFDPNFVVHMTNASDEDIALVAHNRIPVVSCPRANSILGVGFPPLVRMARARLTIALGTDNVMLNPPDMFREMDYVARMVRAIERDPRDPKPADVLKMATINGAKALGMEREIGSIEAGKAADILLVDGTDLNLRHSRDTVASLVLRAGVQNIRAVFAGGKLAYER